MSDIKVFGRLTSANVQKVIWALEELELPYDHENLGGRYGGLSDPLSRDEPQRARAGAPRRVAHPLGEPCNRALPLGRIRRRPAVSDDPRDRAVVDQWTDWTATRFQPAWIGVFWSVFRTQPERRMRGEIAKFAGRSGPVLRDPRPAAEPAALSRRRNADLCRYRRGDRAVPLDDDGESRRCRRASRPGTSGSASGRRFARPSMWTSRS